MSSLVSNTPVMLALTFGAYLLGVWARRKSGIALLHPLFICIPAIIAVLLIFDIPCDLYMESNKIVSFVLGPCVVALGLKLYDHRKIVIENLPAIASAVIVGSVVSIASVIILGKVCGLSDLMILSLEPKSVTTPIAMDIVENLGGNASLAAVTVVLSGFVGNVIGPAFMNILGIRNPIARGAGMGCSSHGLGTAKAIEEGALEGAVSGLCIALMGVATAFAVPFFNM
ncbi:MAG: LrgB family protein [Bacteroidales bacterium]|nr:LrgB family protein [Bacteroidales bacterium]